MQQPDPYTNIRGETFTIALEEASVPSEADYWGFYFVVTDSQSRKRAFRYVAKKNFLTRPDEAKKFAFGDPLTMLYGLLDAVQDGRGPLLLPDLGKGWEVF